MAALVISRLCKGGRRCASGLVFALSLTTAWLPGQDGADADTPAKRQREQVVRRLRLLDLTYTDWTLLRTVGEQVAVLGAAAQPPVAVEVELARTNADPRYRVRLLGVQVGIDQEVALAELERLVGADDEPLASLAARVLGRSGAPPPWVGRLLQERMAKEPRAGVRAALLLAAGEAGAAGVAPFLRTMVEKGGIAGGELPWAWLALAWTADEELLPQARLWLAPHSPLLGAAVLLARRFADGEAERPLVRLLETERAEPMATWIAQSLGACGGDAARRALRASIEVDDGLRNGVVVVNSFVDPRQLALLRLGDKAARDWAEGRVARAGTLLDSGAGRVPELFGRWRIEGAEALLTAWVASRELPAIARASAARGLCWLGRPAGLMAAADVIGEAGADALSATVVAAWQLAQRTLHEFVANLDRPDCHGFVPGDARKAEAVARQWRDWLRERGDAVRWRRPGEDAEDLRCWF